MANARAADLFFGLAAVGDGMSDGQSVVHTQ